jgi:acetyltransferase-like isoleucine patch superfamily enzyme
MIVLIKDHTHICPGVVIIAGNVKIGKNCWIGLGARIIENCILEIMFLLQQDLCYKNIKSNSFVKGIPAKYARKKLAKF